MHERILRAIAENPGAGRRAICRAACVRDSAGSQAIGDLEEAGRIVNRGAPGLGRYYLAGSERHSHAATQASPSRADAAPADMGHAEPVGDPRGLGEGDGDTGARLTGKEIPMDSVPAVGCYGGGEWRSFAVLSDLHAGSECCEDDAASEFLEYAYTEHGVRHVLMPGDTTQGVDPKWAGELRYRTEHEQIDHVHRILPRLAGLHYHAIGGNHDAKWSNATGDSMGDHLVARFLSHGRQDFHAYDDRCALLDFAGLRVDMWHPNGAAPDNPGLPMMKRARRYRLDRRAHLLLVGHWHRWAHVREKDTECIACPTYQNDASSFARSLPYEPAIGGVILHVRMVGDDVIDTVAHYRPARRAPKWVSVPAGVVAEAPSAVGWARCG